MRNPVTFLRVKYAVWRINLNHKRALKLAKQIDELIARKKHEGKWYCPVCKEWCVEWHWHPTAPH